MSKISINFNFALVVLSDFSRHLLLVLLFLAVLGSALAVVISAHKNRQLIIVQEQLIKEKDALDVKWRHLIIEQSALTEHNRIEREVADKLDMKRPSREDEVLLRLK